jgi:hypothetical protein
MTLKQDFAHPVNRSDSPDHSRGESTACGLVNRANNPVPSFARDQFHNVHPCLLVRRLNQIMPGHRPLMRAKTMRVHGKKCEALLAGIRHQFGGESLSSGIEEVGRREPTPLLDLRRTGPIN